VDRLVPVLRETMETALPLDVPLTVDIKVGDDWDTMTPVSPVTPVSLGSPATPVAPVPG
jgi:hypothetical protein